MRYAIYAVVAVAAVVSASCTRAEATVEPTLDEVRAATEKYRDVNVALADGYIPDPAGICDVASMMGQPAELGGMGIHYLRPDLLGIAGPPNPRVTGTGTHIDFLRPGVLIYEPMEDGSLELVAIENLVFVRPWEEAGNAAPPSFQGVPYDYMADDPATAVDEAHGFEPHYDRHVWLYRENATGMFAQYNPTVTCRHHQQPASHQH
jgi:hypothetical protein